MATAKKAAKADTKEPKAAKAAAAAAPTASPPAAPPAEPPAAPPAAETSNQATGDGEKPFVAPDAAQAPAPASTQTAVHRLERAQALPELAKGEKSSLVTEGIQSFKDTDRRTMNVVLVGDALHKQEV